MNMFEPNNTPYDALINLSNRVNILEQNQQEIIRGLQHNQATLSTLMESMKNLQRFVISINEQIRTIRSSDG